MNVTIDMADVAKEFLTQEKTLAYRPIGAKVRPLIEEIIKKGEDNSTYILDFQGVRLSETSFLDETVVELTAHCQEHRYGERLVAISNMSETTLENLHSAILLRDDKKKQKVPVVNLTGDKLEVIPVLEESLLAVLNLTFEKGLITTIEVQEVFKIELPSASMRLKRLYEYGFLRRVLELIGNGKRFIYYPIGK